MHEEYLSEPDSQEITENNEDEETKFTNEIVNRDGQQMRYHNAAACCSKY